LLLCERDERDLPVDFVLKFAPLILNGETEYSVMEASRMTLSITTSTLPSSEVSEASSPLMAGEYGSLDATMTSLPE
jgi:hypothetical protein